MKWKEYKKQITSLDRVQIEQLEIVTQLIIRRKEMGLTQQELAEEIGFHQAAIARLESEGAIPRMDTLEKVANALGLKLALIDEEAASLETEID